MAERKIGLADTYGTTAVVECREDGEIKVELGVGLCGGYGLPTPEAARQIAAALLDAADTADRIPAEGGES